MEKFKVITKENIIDNFIYYDLVPLQKCLGLDGVINIASTRIDLDLAYKPTVFSQDGSTEGRYDGSNFYSLEHIEKVKKEVEAIADIVMGILKLKELRPIYEKRTKEAELQYWGSDYTMFYVVDYDKEKKEWHLIKLEKSNHNPQNWSD